MKAKLEYKRWREFADWVKATVELENQEVVQSLNNSTLEWRQGRRDAFEDVWGIVLAFNEDCEETKCPRCEGAGTYVDYEDTVQARYFRQCHRCGGKGYLQGEEN